MKKTMLKTTAAVLSALLVLGIGSSAVSAETVRRASPAPAVIAAGASPAAKKDETVYVLSGADGSRQQVIVSSWLQNTDKSAVMTDRSDLNGIENVKGMEVFTSSGDGSLSWEAAGQDIYYQGTSDQALPVEISISYTLDGKPVSPEALAGQSGRVTIRFDYRSVLEKDVKIGGKSQKIHVPFLMMTTAALDTEIFRNVSVKNAMAENLGNTTAIVGLALPGLQENLNLGKDVLEIPDYVEITADVEHFEMGPTMTIATASLFQNLKADDLSPENIKDQAKTLTDGISRLLDGSNQLYDGLNTLLEKSGALTDGIDQLSAGAIRLQAGADTLVSGASQLQSGAAQLSGGLDQLDANSGALNEGARQVFLTLLSTANSQLANAGLDVPAMTIDNYADVLNTVIASLDENAVYEAALQQVTAGVQARRGEIRAAVTDVVRQQVEAEATVLVTQAVREKVTEEVDKNESTIRALVIFKHTGMTPAVYDAAVKAGLISQEKQEAIAQAVIAAKAAEVEKQMNSAKVQATIASITKEKVDEKMQSPEIQAIIEENTDIQVEKIISETMASPEVQQQLEAAAEGARSVIGLKASLDSYNGFYLGLLTYTSGVSAAAGGAHDLISGTQQLQAGTESLSAGVGTLNSGVQTMKDQTPALIEGITALRDGAGTMRDGIAKMMTEGIEKLADLADEDLSELSARLTASLDAANAYNTFSGRCPQTESSVKFIYKTASISAEH